MSSGVSTKVDRRDLIIPGLCAGAERQIEMMTKWKVKVGPRSGFELPLCFQRDDDHRSDNAFSALMALRVTHLLSLPLRSIVVTKRPGK